MHDVYEAIIAGNTEDATKHICLVAAIHVVIQAVASEEPTDDMEISATETRTTFFNLRDTRGCIVFRIKQGSGKRYVRPLASVAPDECAYIQMIDGWAELPDKVDERISFQTSDFAEYTGDFKVTFIRKASVSCSNDCEHKLSTEHNFPYSWKSGIPTTK